MVADLFWVECGARTHEAFGTQARLSNALNYNGLNIYFAVSKVCQMTQSLTHFLRFKFDCKGTKKS